VICAADGVQIIGNVSACAKQISEPKLQVVGYNTTIASTRIITVASFSHAYGVKLSTQLG
jgi:hypothetical protein